MSIMCLRIYSIICVCVVQYVCVRRGSIAKVEWNGAKGRKRRSGDPCAAPTTLPTQTDAHCYGFDASTTLSCASSTEDGAKVSVQLRSNGYLQDRVV
jgi:hypothetical protein